MKIAVAKEIDPSEPRVAASPDTVKKYRALGVDIAVEPGAGALTVRSESTSAEPIRLHVPATTAAGTYTVTFALHAGHGTTLPDVVTEVEVS